MKKIFMYSILIIIFILFLKYYNSNYKMEYKLDNYIIKTVYKNKRFYYEIKDNDHIYNFDIYGKRKLSKSKINKITIIEDESFKCIYPTIKDIKTYPLCYVNDVYTDYNLIESDLLKDYKNENKDDGKPIKDFVYFNNLNNNEHIALWNYKGYTIMSGKSYRNIELFKKDKYDNTLAYLYDKYIYMANNDQNHEYNSLVKLDITDFSHETIDLGYNLDFDSYIVGSVKKNIYIFDNKYSILYEFNTKKKETKIIGNNEMGFVKYENGKFVPCSKTEYKTDKIRYNNELESNYVYKSNNGIFKTIKNNNKVNQKIINGDVKLLKEFNNKIYYSNNNYLYMYTPNNGSNKVFYYYELEFNGNNMIFVYND